MSPSTQVAELANGIVTSERLSQVFAAVLKVLKSMSFVSSNPLPYLSFNNKSNVCIAGLVEALKSFPLPLIL